MRRAWLWLIQRTLNKWTLAAAKRGRGPFSLVRHVGRKSGKTFETPIIVAAVDGGFVAELTYGEDVNWYQNVMATGGCELVVAGTPHRVIGVEPFAAEAGRRAFGPVAGMVLRVLRRKEFRLLRTAARP